MVNQLLEVAVWVCMMALAAGLWGLQAGVIVSGGIIGLLVSQKYYYRNQLGIAVEALMHVNTAVPRKEKKNESDRK